MGLSLITQSYKSEGTLRGPSLFSNELTSFDKIHIIFLMKQKRKNKGISLLEVLLSAGLFTVVILGISQTVLLMHRYSRANICKMKAHLLATSYFESILHDTHPYELNKSGSTVSLRKIDNPLDTFSFKIDRNTYSQSEGSYANLNTFTINIYDDTSELKVYMLLLVKDSPFYDFYLKEGETTDSVENTLERTEINPPEGFQALRLTYWYTDPFMKKEASAQTEGTAAYLSCLSHNELYAIRPIQPDDPEYDI